MFVIRAIAGTSIGFNSVGSPRSRRRNTATCSERGKKVKLSRDTPRWPKGFREVKAPDFLDFRHYKGGKIVTLRHRPSLPPGVSWYSFLEAESSPGYLVPSEATENIPSDTTGNRSRDPPINSAVP
jgi:hypothetical protein